MESVLPAFAKWRNQIPLISHDHFTGNLLHTATRLADSLCGVQPRFGLRSSEGSYGDNVPWVADQGPGLLMKGGCNGLGNVAQCTMLI